MKRWFVEVAALSLVALLLAGATWFFRGGSESSELCQRDQLKEDEVCMEDVLDLAGVVWVDARTRELWKKNGVPGSVFLTDHADEDWEELIALAIEQLFQAEQVVVYCATKGCGSSRAVATKIQDLGLLEPEQIKVLAGGWKAWATRDANRKIAPEPLQDGEG